MTGNNLNLDYLELVTIKQYLMFTQNNNSELNLEKLIKKIDEAIKEWT